MVSQREVFREDYVGGEHGRQTRPFGCILEAVLCVLTPHSPLTSSTDDVIYRKTDGTWKTEDSRWRSNVLEKLQCSRQKELQFPAVQPANKKLIIRKSLHSYTPTNSTLWTLSIFLSFWSPPWPRLLTETQQQLQPHQDQQPKRFLGLQWRRRSSWWEFWHWNCQFGRISSVFLASVFLFWLPIYAASWTCVSC